MSFVMSLTLIRGGRSPLFDHAETEGGDAQARVFELLRSRAEVVDDPESDPERRRRSRLSHRDARLDPARSRRPSLRLQSLRPVHGEPERRRADLLGQLGLFVLRLCEIRVRGADEHLRPVPGPLRVTRRDRIRCRRGWPMSGGRSSSTTSQRLRHSPPGSPAVIPVVDGVATDLDARAKWPAYGIGLRRVYSPLTWEVKPLWKDATAHEALRVPDERKIVLVGYGTDPLVEAFWTRRHRLYEFLAKKQFDLVLAPNYSMYGSQPTRRAPVELPPQPPRLGGDEHGGDPGGPEHLLVPQGRPRPVPLLGRRRRTRRARDQPPDPAHQRGLGGDGPSRPLVSRDRARREGEAHLQRDDPPRPPRHPDRALRARSPRAPHPKPDPRRPARKSDRTRREDRRRQSPARRRLRHQRGQRLGAPLVAQQPGTRCRDMGDVRSHTTNRVPEKSVTPRG